MQLPVVQGLIVRRLLLNYRIVPDVIAPLIPAPFRPKLVRGVAIAGVCLIHLQAVRPRGVPAWLGINSQNAAHRIAVEWDDAGQVKEGVYIPRRDTNSRINTLVGGRLFPGIHQHARFTTSETAQFISIRLTSDDSRVEVHVTGRPTSALPPDSVFHSVAEASIFFERGALGYSATGDPNRFDGLELRSYGWRVEAFAVEQVESSFFADRCLFPPDTATFDCALLMRNIAHEWHGHDQLCSRTCRAG